MIANTAVSVLIVDDQEPFRLAAATVVRMSPGFEVVAEARSGEEAVSAAEFLRPDMVLMDIVLPGISGIAATRRILARRPDTVVIVLSTYSQEDLPDDVATCGAAGYVHKEDFGPGVMREMWDQR